MQGAAANLGEGNAHLSQSRALLPRTLTLVLLFRTINEYFECHCIFHVVRGRCQRNIGWASMLARLHMPSFRMQSSRQPPSRGGGLHHQNTQTRTRGSPDHIRGLPGVGRANATEQDE